MSCKIRVRDEIYTARCGIFLMLMQTRWVQVCNLNLEVYVFLGVVTVQLGIVCSNYKVQVANLNPPSKVTVWFFEKFLQWWIIVTVGVIHELPLHAVTKACSSMHVFKKLNCYAYSNKCRTTAGLIQRGTSYD